MSLSNASKAVAAGRAQRTRVREALLPWQASSLPATFEHPKERSSTLLSFRDLSLLSQPYEAAVSVVGIYDKGEGASGNVSQSAVWFDLVEVMGLCGKLRF